MRDGVIAGIVLMCVMSAAPNARAQTPAVKSAEPPDRTLKFEVASVKPNTSGPDSYLWRYRGDRFTARYQTLKSLISTAYGAQEHALTAQQIVGGPEWLDADHFDIEATAPGTPESPRGTFTMPVLLMLRNLLEERFHLATHVEQKEMQLYALVLARHDGTLGPRLRRRVLGCTAAAAGDPKAPPTPRSLATHQVCGGQVFPGTLIATGLTMTNLIDALARLVPGVDRIVVDRTRLIGTFDVELTWAPDTTFEKDAAAAAPFGNANAPSFFTALQEQLGLRLEPTKSSVDVLLIDHTERPSQD